MSDFKQDAKSLLDNIGGKENINAVTHCATRMRFVLNDPKQADVNAIEDIPSVKGTFTQSGQFQVIIGNKVADFYNDFEAVSGVSGTSKEAVKAAAADQQQNWLQKAMTFLAEVFAPIIPAIIVGGLILGFRNVLEGVPMEFLGQKIVDGVAQTMGDGTPQYNTIVDVSTFWAGVNSFLWLPGEAIFHFLPVGITWSVTRKMGTTQILGIVLVFAPIIPAIIVGGLILGFRNVLEGVPMEFLGQKIVDGVAQTMGDGTPQYNTIVDVSTFWAGVNSFLWLPGEAIFHFLPVGITWSVTRKMGTTQILGIVLGITLVSPQLLNAYAAPDAILAGEVPQWDFGFFQLDMIGYQAQVLPAMFAGLSLAWLEKFWRKYIPEMISMIFVPFLSLVPAIILAHTVLGPIGWTVGTWISSVVYAGLTGPVSWLFGLIFGALYSPLVITGLHHMTNAIDTQLVADFGGTGLWPMIALSNIAQASAVMAIWWTTRQDEKESQITIPSAVSAYLGVTEPAMFGVTIKYVYPFIAAMIGSGLAGLLSTSVGITANSIGVGGLPGILAIQFPYWGWFLLAMAIAIVVPFALTIVFKKTGFLANNKLDFNIKF